MNQRFRMPTGGFTLVELMIVVAILGILAAIAIPNYITMQLKAKRAEVPPNVDGIKRMEIAYDAAFDGYMDAGIQPRGDGDLDKDLYTWAGTYDEWTSLGWAPDGEVRGNYRVEVVAGTPETFTAIGLCDVDDDDLRAEYMATQNSNATLSASSQAFY